MAQLRYVGEVPVFLPTYYRVAEPGEVIAIPDADLARFEHRGDFEVLRPPTVDQPNVAPEPEPSEPPAAVEAPAERKGRSK